MNHGGPCFYLKSVKLITIRYLALLPVRSDEAEFSSRLNRIGFSNITVLDEIEIDKSCV